jgi:hypothetical protein
LRARAVLAIVGLAAAIVFVYLVNFSPRVSVDMETNSTVVIECDPIGAAFSSFWVLISNGGAIDASVVQGQDAVDRKQRMWTQEGLKAGATVTFSGCTLSGATSSMAA